MAIDYEALLVYGFEMQISNAYKAMTRYNQVTGEPVVKQVFSHQEGIIQGKIFKPTASPYFDDSFESLDIFDPTYESDSNTKYLGVLVKLATESNGGAEVNPIDLLNEEVGDFAEKYELIPKIYLLLDVS